jgi:hypothetical protein
VPSGPFLLDVEDQFALLRRENRANDLVSLPVFFDDVASANFAICKFFSADDGRATRYRKILGRNYKRLANRLSFQLSDVCNTAQQFFLRHNRAARKSKLKMQSAEVRRKSGGY